MMAPMEQSVRATTLTVIWNCRNRRMLSYTDLPAPARRTLARRPEGGGGIAARRWPHRRAASLAPPSSDAERSRPNLQALERGCVHARKSV